MIKLRCLLGHDYKTIKPEYGFGDSPLDRAVIAHGGYPDIGPAALHCYMRSYRYVCKRCGKERLA